MIFFLTFVFSVVCSYFAQKYWGQISGHSFTAYLLLYSPVWVLWLLICGSQYEVGTDYVAYYEIFSNAESYSHFYLAKGEWLFTLIILSLHKLGISTQLFFAFFYSINFLCLIGIMYLLKDRSAWLFVFLFIAFSTVFNNQLNGLRQYTAIYIVTFAYICYYHKRSLPLLLIQIVLAGGIHLSAYLTLPFIFVLKWKFKSKTSLILLAIASYFALFGNLGVFNDFITTYVPLYKAYLESDFNTSNSSSIILTKFIFLPIYLYAVKLVKTNHINDFDLYVFRIGILGYAIRLAFLGNMIFNRVGQTFVLISILPVYIALKIMYSKNKLTPFILTTSFIAFFYLLKTIAFPKQEYLHNSIFFQ